MIIIWYYFKTIVLFPTVYAMFMKIKVLDVRVTIKQNNIIMEALSPLCKYLLHVRSINTNLFIDSFALDLHYYPYL